MQIKSKFNIKIEPKDWAYLILTAIALLHLIKGDVISALKVLTK
ncbi:hypothetical protein SAMN05660816_06946 [Niastella yeongjuensis]|nr:hypothetical protein SAMN05660816_06946 [Niastella yeongjuensis]